VVRLRERSVGVNYSTRPNSSLQESAIYHTAKYILTDILGENSFSGQRLRTGGFIAFFLYTKQTLADEESLLGH
jgi:hypothetical protein